MSSSYVVGRELSLWREDGRGVEVEGAKRLLPGRVIRLTGLESAGPTGRLALVAAWRVVRFDSLGPVYRGYCQWIDCQGKAAPGSASET